MNDIDIHVGYCRVHHTTILDSCPYCEEANATWITYTELAKLERGVPVLTGLPIRLECPECHVLYKKDIDFTWSIVEAAPLLICWACTDKINKAELTKNGCRST